MAASLKNWSRRAGAALAAVLASLALAEGGAAAMRGNAFPYLNIFVADETLGVRLSPDERTFVRSRNGNVTEIQTSTRAYRGPVWPSAAERTRVLVLGDSQALGLHVPWASTFAARLGERFDVLDAAVPTWGPPEYELVLDEELRAGSPDAVVYVVNVANDFQEAGVPNRLRTTARDGWAVRPSRGEVVEFPGREWLLGRSHVVYAARQVMGRVTSVAPIRADAARALSTELRSLTHATPPWSSRLGPFLERARTRCERANARLVVAVLPVDVQVYSREWAKYGVRPIDMRATEALAGGVVTDATGLGIAVVDLLPVLRRSSPGAFLPDDPHLSSRGHEAVARAVRALLEEEGA